MSRLTIGLGVSLGLGLVTIVASTPASADYCHVNKLCPDGVHTHTICCQDASAGSALTTTSGQFCGAISTGPGGVDIAGGAVSPSYQHGCVLSADLPGGPGSCGANGAHAADVCETYGCATDTGCP